jgi:hypothetical protein
MTRLALIAAAAAGLAATALHPAPVQAQDPVGLLRHLTSPLRSILRGPRVKRRSLRRHPTATRKPPAAERGTVGRRHRDAGVPSTAAAAGAASAAVLWPSAAPNAYEEMLGYALWPSDYGHRFWAHGPRDIIQVMIMPSDAIAHGPEKPQPRSKRTRVAGVADSDETTGATAASCIERAKAAAMKPIDRIPTTIEINDTQRQKLAALRDAVTAAIERERDACASEAQDTPPQRMQAMVRALWGLRYAEFHIRTALNDFFDSLNEAQKTQLSESQTRHPTPATQSSPAELCRTQGVEKSDLFNRFQKSLQVTEEQRESYKMLLGASIEMSRYLTRTCPEKTPPTAMARFDAAGDRIIAMLQAATGIEPVLGAFYAKLTDEQQARLN